MIRITATILGIAIALSGAAQSDYVENWNPDADGDGNVGVTDLLALLSVFSFNDIDGDGIWDHVDDCIGVYDPCGVCNGIGEDADGDGVCDDVDDCVGAYDECGVCNGLGPNIPVIDEILYETDSIYIEVLGEWYVFELPPDTLFTYVCPDPCNGLSSVTFDNFTYGLVAIGNQCWFAENLQTEHYANGDEIPADLSDGEWNSTTNGAVTVYGEDSGCNNYSPDGDACDPTWSLNEYGRLYNLYAVDDERGLCPTGWHVPTDEEWTVMTSFLGGSSVAGNEMKTTYGWFNSFNGANSSGFSGLPGGSRSAVNGFFENAGKEASWWSSSPSGSSYGGAWARNLYYYLPHVFRQSLYPRYGFSVRCLKDAE